MANKPLTTRFGPTPTVDEEVAIKSYVDGQARPIIFNNGPLAAQNSALTRFYALGGSIANATEGNVDITLFSTMRVRRLSMVVLSNSVNGDSTLTFRDDAGDVASITIGASTGGVVETGAINVEVLAGSLIDWQLVTEGSTGAITIESITLQTT